MSRYTPADLCRLLGIRYPIIQAPMAGATTPQLVAAVSNAGGLGMFAGAYLSPEQIRAGMEAVRELTEAPFGVNLFAGGADFDASPGVEPMLAILREYHAQLGIDPPSVAAQLDAVIESGVSIFRFPFGLPDAADIARLTEGGVTVIGTATTVGEASQLEAAGVDAIVAQGSEAGAHRGTFAAAFESALVGTIALVPQVVDAVGVPVIASGGIMDGRGIVAAEALGAAGVQLGTAFLTTREAGIPDAYKAAIRAARADDTTITRAFSGRPARGIVNTFIETLHDHEDAILPFPLQNTLTRPLRDAANAAGDTRFMSLWAGQGAPLARETSAGELVEQLVREADEIRNRLSSNRR
jgi:nitronate monooxygenase